LYTILIKAHMEHLLFSSLCY